MIISTLIPAESHIACQRQGAVIIDSIGVVCLVKIIKSQLLVFVTGKVDDKYLSLLFLLPNLRLRSGGHEEACSLIKF